MKLAYLALATWLCLTPALAACCPADPDTLQKEADTILGILDILAGKVSRLPARYYEQELEAANKAIAAAPDNLDNYLRAAEALDALIRPMEAITLLEGRDVAKLSPADRQRRDTLLTRVYVHQWLIEQDPSPGTADVAMQRSMTAVPNGLLSRLLRWMKDPPPVKADEMLPDYFGLRLASNKTALADNEMLRNMGLSGVPDFLVSMINLSPLWENVDTYYALSLALGIMGKQHLAYFARLRVDELLQSGKASRLMLPEAVRDIRPLLVTRQEKAGVLAEIPTLSDESKKLAEVEFLRRRRETSGWLQAREAFAAKRLEEGKSPASGADFWQGFAYTGATTPAATAGAAAGSAASNDAGTGSDDGNTTAIIAAASASVCVVLVVTLSSRRRKPKVPQET